jgi:hypothetical protein
MARWRWCCTPCCSTPRDHGDGLDLGVANAISLLVWLTPLIYWLARLAYEGLGGIMG